MIRALLLLSVLSFPFSVWAAKGKALAYPQVDEPPRVMAVLQQGYAAERGIGLRRNYSLAMALYCDAGTMGSPEGFYRVGRILKNSNRRAANGYFALAARLGHHEAAKHHDPRIANADVSSGCGNYYAWMESGSFDMDGYVANLATHKRKVAALIRSLAPQFGVDIGFALGIALAESNLEPRAVSPKKAQGVMQLIPETQARFGVKNPFDPQQNIRGGLVYLRWLQQRYAGNKVLVAAAYNAGEGAVDKYRGVPPYAETQHYVRRVMYFSGSSLKKAAAKKESAANANKKAVPENSAPVIRESEKPSVAGQT